MPNDTQAKDPTIQNSTDPGLPNLPEDSGTSSPSLTSATQNPPATFRPTVATVQDSSILNPAPPVVMGDQVTPPPPSDGSGGSTTTSSYVPKKYGGKKIIATIFGVFFLVGAVAAGVILVQKYQLFNQKANEGEGNIAIFKYICDNIGGQDVCNGRDTSLGNYKVDFKVHQGDNDQGPVVQTITVTISDNNNGQGNTGNASQGRSVGDALNVGTYTFCEIPVAYNSTGDRVPLDVEPRPEASNGGSSGGTNQTQYSQNCIKVDLTPGEAELKYLDKRQTPAASPTPAATSTVTPTKKPGATNTVTPKPTVTSVATPTLVPGIIAQCLTVKTYSQSGTLLTPSDLAALKSGDKVRFAVAGQASSGSFSKARFTVNGTLLGETTTTNASGEFTLDYTIPANVKTFTVKGEVNHSTLGWI